MSLFRSFCARQTRAPYIIAMTDNISIGFMKNLVASGNIGMENLRNP
jgi:hypothetical protein